MAIQPIDTTATQYSSGGLSHKSKTSADPLVLEFPNDGMPVKVKFGSSQEKNEFIFQANQVFGADWKNNPELVSMVLGMLKAPEEVGGDLIYQPSTVLSNRLKKGDIVFSEFYGLSGLNEKSQFEISNSSGTKRQYFLRIGAVLLKFDSEQARANLIDLLTRYTGNDLESLTSNEVSHVLKNFFPNHETEFVGDASLPYFVLNPGLEKALAMTKPLVPLTNGDYRYNPEGSDSSLFGPGSSTLSMGLMRLYDDSSYSSALVGDTEQLRSARFSTLIFAATNLYKKNNSQVSLVKNIPPELAQLVKAVFGNVPVNNVHLSIFFQLGLVNFDSKGQYVISDQGKVALTDFSDFYQKPNVPKFVPSVVLHLMLSPYEISQLTKNGSPAFVKEFYNEFYKKNQNLVNANEEKFSGGRLQGNSQAVLAKIFGPKTSTDGHSPYNATQVNLAVAAGYLQIDSKGVITATTKGQDLLKPKPAASDPAASQPDPLISALELVLADLKKPKKERKYDKNGDGVIAKSELEQIVNPLNVDSPKDEKDAAQKILDAWNNKDKRMPTLLMGNASKLDDKFSTQELETFLKGMKDWGAVKNWDAGFQVDGNGKSTGVPIGKTNKQYVADILNDLVSKYFDKNKFDTSATVPDYISLDEDSINGMCGSKDQNIKVLGEGLRWLKQFYPSILDMIVGDDNKASKADIARVFDALGYEAPKPVSTAAPAA